ncbi:MAG: hypothetical protein FWD90_07030 [Defluviitaleaceae bacterium]|nr:hypothetical protein [Defluviitaleaceae bacterium]
MDKDLFDHLIASCKEAIEYRKGNIQLKTTCLELPEDEVDADTLLWYKITTLPKAKKQKATQYVDELLQASG